MNKVWPARDSDADESSIYRYLFTLFSNGKVQDVARLALEILTNARQSSEAHAAHLA
jgi:hypothetical protein